jgi:cytochrome c-type biogenesis protein CcmH
MAGSQLAFIGVGLALLAVGVVAWALAGSWSTLAPRSRTRLIVGGIVAAGMLPVLGVGLYFNLGDGAPTRAVAGWPQMPPDHPDVSQQQALSDVETMTARLAARLEREPNDADGWRMLGWSYFHIDRYAESVAAYGKAITLRPDNADYRSAQAEAMVRADGDKMTERARQAFAEALKRDPRDPRARFYGAVAKLEDGDRRGALDAWAALVKDIPAEEPLSAEVRERIVKLAGELGVDPAPLMPAAAPRAAAPFAPASPMPGPTAEDIQRAQQMTPEDRQAMIVAMVDRLAARLEDNPRDHEGWLRLARSRKVLGDDAAARAALQRAHVLFADAPAIRAEIEKTSMELGLGKLSTR